jgi:hypothetical protein
MLAAGSSQSQHETGVLGMTNPPRQPGPSGPHDSPHDGPDQPGSSGPQGAPPGGAPGQPAFGGQPQQQPGPHAAPGQHGDWNPAQSAPGGPFPFGTQQAGFGQPGDYDAPRAPSRSRLPWILAGGAALVVLAVVIVLIFTPGGGGGGRGGTDSPRAVAEAFVTAVNERKVPEQQIFCDAFVQEGEEMARGLPGDGEAGQTDAPGFQSKASLADVQQDGDTATAVVEFELGSGEELIKGEYNLSIRKEDGNWRICDFEVGNIEIPGIGG